jgi:hypothetical protein
MNWRLAEKVLIENDMQLGHIKPPATAIELVERVLMKDGVQLLQHRKATFR